MGENSTDQLKNKQLIDLIPGFGEEDFFKKLDTVEKEKAFVKLLVANARLILRQDYIGIKMPNTTAINTLGRWTKEVFCEDVSALRDGMNTRRDTRMSWPLFAQWVQTCRLDYPNIYKKYADKIHRRFNISRFLAEAAAAATHSKCHKLHVGSVLVIDGDVKARGWTFHPKCTRRDDVCLRMKTKHATDISHGYCIHSEMQIIARCNPRQLKNGILFITHSPCQHCARHLIQAEVPFVVYRIGEHPTDGPDMAWDLGGKTRFYGV